MRKLYRGAPEEYHHSQTTQATREDCDAAVGTRVALVLTGTIVEARTADAGSYVVFEPDERFGFGNSRFGGDLELFTKEGEE